MPYTYSQCDKFPYNHDTGNTFVDDDGNAAWAGFVFDDGGENETVLCLASNFLWAEIELVDLGSQGFYGEGSHLPLVGDWPVDGDWDMLKHDFREFKFIGETMLTSIEAIHLKSVESRLAGEGPLTNFRELIFEKQNGAFPSAQIPSYIWDMNYLEKLRIIDIPLNYDTFPPDIQNLTLLNTLEISNTIHVPENNNPLNNDDYFFGSTSGGAGLPPVELAYLPIEDLSWNFNVSNEHEGLIPNDIFQINSLKNYEIYGNSIRAGINEGRHPGTDDGLWDYEYDQWNLPNLEKIHIAGNGKYQIIDLGILVDELSITSPETKFIEIGGMWKYQQFMDGAVVGSISNNISNFTNLKYFKIFLNRSGRLCAHGDNVRCNNLHTDPGNPGDINSYYNGNDDGLDLEWTSNGTDMERSIEGSDIQSMMNIISLEEIAMFNVLGYHLPTTGLSENMWRTTFDNNLTHHTNEEHGISDEDYYGNFIASSVTGDITSFPYTDTPMNITVSNISIGCKEGMTDIRSICDPFPYDLYCDQNIVHCDDYCDGSSCDGTINTFFDNFPDTALPEIVNVDSPRHSWKTDTRGFLGGYFPENLWDRYQSTNLPNGPRLKFFETSIYGNIPSFPPGFRLHTFQVRYSHLDGFEDDSICTNLIEGTSTGWTGGMAYGCLYPYEDGNYYMYGELMDYFGTCNQGLQLIGNRICNAPYCIKDHPSMDPDSPFYVTSESSHMLGEQSLDYCMPEPYSSNLWLDYNDANPANYLLPDNFAGGDPYTNRDWFFESENQWYSFHDNSTFLNNFKLIQDAIDYHTVEDDVRGFINKIEPTLGATYPNTTSSLEIRDWTWQTEYGHREFYDTWIEVQGTPFATDAPNNCETECENCHMNLVKVKVDASGYNGMWADGTVGNPFEELGLQRELWDAAWLVSWCICNDESSTDCAYSSYEELHKAYAWANNGWEGVACLDPLAKNYGMSASNENVFNLLKIYSFENLDFEDTYDHDQFLQVYVNRDSVDSPNDYSIFSHPDVYNSNISNYTGLFSSDYEFWGPVSSIHYYPLCNYITDCNEDYAGTAFIDDCGICSSGNTDRIPNCYDIPHGMYGNRDYYTSGCDKYIKDNSSYYPVSYDEGLIKYRTRCGDDTCSPNIGCDGFCDTGGRSHSEVTDGSQVWNDDADDWEDPNTVDCIDTLNPLLNTILTSEGIDSGGLFTGNIMSHVRLNHPHGAYEYMPTGPAYDKFQNSFTVHASYPFAQHNWYDEQHCVTHQTLSDGSEDCVEGYGWNPTGTCYDTSVSSTPHRKNLSQCLALRAYYDYEQQINYYYENKWAHQITSFGPHDGTGYNTEYVTDYLALWGIENYQSEYNDANYIHPHWFSPYSNYAIGINSFPNNSNISPFFNEGFYDHSVCCDIFYGDHPLDPSFDAPPVHRSPNLNKNDYLSPFGSWEVRDDVYDVQGFSEYQEHSILYEHKDDSKWCGEEYYNYTHRPVVPYSCNYRVPNKEELLSWLGIVDATACGTAYVDSCGECFNLNQDQEIIINAGPPPGAIGKYIPNSAPNMGDDGCGCGISDSFGIEDWYYDGDGDGFGSGDESHQYCLEYNSILFAPDCGDELASETEYTCSNGDWADYDDIFIGSDFYDDVGIRICDYCTHHPNYPDYDAVLECNTNGEPGWCPNNDDIESGCYNAEFDQLLIDECGYCLEIDCIPIADIIPTDYDGNVYQTVQIGDQLWMAENLKTTHYQNGDPITHITNNGDWSSLSTGAYGDHYNNPASSAELGRYYNYYAVVDSRGVCPIGWHVPTQGEYDVLADFLGGESVAGGKMKEAGLEHWNSPNEGATNESGFTGLPAGKMRANDGTWLSLGGWGNFWSTTNRTANQSWGGVLTRDSTIFDVNGNNNKVDGFSVRCVTSPASEDCTIENTRGGDSYPVISDCTDNGDGTWTCDLSEMSYLLDYGIHPYSYQLLNDNDNGIDISPHLVIGNCSTPGQPGYGKCSVLDCTGECRNGNVDNMWVIDDCGQCCDPTAVTNNQNRCNWIEECIDDFRTSGQNFDCNCHCESTTRLCQDSGCSNGCNPQATANDYSVVDNGDGTYTGTLKTVSCVDWIGNLGHSHGDNFTYYFHYSRGIDACGDCNGENNTENLGERRDWVQSNTENSTWLAEWESNVIDVTPPTLTNTEGHCDCQGSTYDYCNYCGGGRQPWMDTPYANSVISPEDFEQRNLLINLSEQGYPQYYLKILEGTYYDKVIVDGESDPIYSIGPNMDCAGECQNSRIYDCTSYILHLTEFLNDTVLSLSKFDPAEHCTVGASDSYIGPGCDPEVEGCHSNWYIHPSIEAVDDLYDQHPQFMYNTTVYTDMNNINHGFDYCGVCGGDNSTCSGCKTKDIDNSDTDSHEIGDPCNFDASHFIIPTNLMISDGGSSLNYGCNSDNGCGCQGELSVGGTNPNNLANDHWYTYNDEDLSTPIICCEDPTVNVSGYKCSGISELVDCFNVDYDIDNTGNCSESQIGDDCGLEGSLCQIVPLTGSDHPSWNEDCQPEYELYNGDGAGGSLPKRYVTSDCGNGGIAEPSDEIWCRPKTFCFQSNNGNIGQECTPNYGFGIYNGSENVDCGDGGLYSNEIWCLPHEYAINYYSDDITIIGELKPYPTVQCCSNYVDDFGNCDISQYSLFRSYCIGSYRDPESTTYPGDYIPQYGCPEHWLPIYHSGDFDPGGCMDEGGTGDSDNPSPYLKALNFSSAAEYDVGTCKYPTGIWGVESDYEIDSYGDGSSELCGLIPWCQFNFPDTNIISINDEDLLPDGHYGKKVPEDSNDYIGYGWGIIPLIYDALTFTDPALSIQSEFLKITDSDTSNDNGPNDGRKKSHAYFKVQLVPELIYNLQFKISSHSAQDDGNADGKFYIFVISGDEFDDNINNASMTDPDEILPYLLDKDEDGLNRYIHKIEVPFASCIDSGGVISTSHDYANDCVDTNVTSCGSNGEGTCLHNIDVEFNDLSLEYGYGNQWESTDFESIGVPELNEDNFRSGYIPYFYVPSINCDGSGCDAYILITHSIYLECNDGVDNKCSGKNYGDDCDGGTCEFFSDNGNIPSTQPSSTYIDYIKLFQYNVDAQECGDVDCIDDYPLDGTPNFITIDDHFGCNGIFADTDKITDDCGNCHGVCFSRNSTINFLKKIPIPDIPLRGMIEKQYICSNCGVMQIDGNEESCHNNCFNQIDCGDDGDGNFTGKCMDITELLDTYGHCYHPTMFNTSDFSGDPSGCIDCSALYGNYNVYDECGICGGSSVEDDCADEGQGGNGDGSGCMNQDTIYVYEDMYRQMDTCGTCCYYNFNCTHRGDDNSCVADDGTPFYPTFVEHEGNCEGRIILYSDSDQDGFICNNYGTYYTCINGADSDVNENGTPCVELTHNECMVAESGEYCTVICPNDECEENSSIAPVDSVCRIDYPLPGWKSEWQSTGWESDYNSCECFTYVDACGVCGGSNSTCSGCTSQFGICSISEDECDVVGDCPNPDDVCLGVCNYNPNATIDDGSCSYEKYCWFDTEDMGWSGDFTYGDYEWVSQICGSCPYGWVEGNNLSPYVGCMDQDSLNYSSLAVIGCEDDCCVYDIVEGCSIPSADNYYCFDNYNDPCGVGFWNESPPEWIIDNTICEFDSAPCGLIPYCTFDSEDAISQDTFPATGLYSGWSYLSNSDIGDINKLSISDSKLNIGYKGEFITFIYQKIKLRYNKLYNLNINFADLSDFTDVGDTNRYYFIVKSDIFENEFLPRISIRSNQSSFDWLMDEDNSSYSSDEIIFTYNQDWTSPIDGQYQFHVMDQQKTEFDDDEFFILYGMHGTYHGGSSIYYDKINYIKVLLSEESFGCDFVPEHSSWAVWDNCGQCCDNQLEFTSENCQSAYPPPCGCSDLGCGCFMPEPSKYQLDQDRDLNITGISGYYGVDWSSVTYYCEEISDTKEHTESVDSETTIKYPFWGNVSGTCVWNQSPLEDPSIIPNCGGFDNGDCNINSADCEWVEPTGPLSYTKFPGIYQPNNWIDVYQWEYDNNPSLIPQESPDDDVPLACAVYGCTNPNSGNYNEDATYDDGTCRFCYDPNFIVVGDVYNCNTDPESYELNTGELVFRLNKFDYLSHSYSDIVADNIKLQIYDPVIDGFDSNSISWYDCTESNAECRFAQGDFYQAIINIDDEAYNELDYSTNIKFYYYIDITGTGAGTDADGTIIKDYIKRYIIPDRNYPSFTGTPNDLPLFYNYDGSFESSNLPILKLDVNDSISSGEVDIISLKSVYNEIGNVNSIHGALFNNEDSNFTIKLEDNPTQDNSPKKEYRIKYYDGDDGSKNILETGNSDEWNLYPLYYDKSFVHNGLSNRLWDEMGQTSFEFKYIELIINDEYQGTYIIRNVINKNTLNLVVEHTLTNDIVINEFMTSSEIEDSYTAYCDNGSGTVTGDETKDVCLCGDGGDWQGGNCTNDTESSCEPGDCVMGSPTDNIWMSDGVQCINDGFCDEDFVRDADYIELYNNSTDDIFLSGNTTDSRDPWMIRDGGDQGKFYIPTVNCIENECVGGPNKGESCTSDENNESDECSFKILDGDYIMIWADNSSDITECKGDDTATPDPIPDRCCFVAGDYGEFNYNGGKGVYVCKELHTLFKLKSSEDWIQLFDNTGQEKDFVIWSSSPETEDTSLYSDITLVPFPGMVQSLDNDEHNNSFGRCENGHVGYNVWTKYIFGSDIPPTPGGANSDNCPPATNALYNYIDGSSTGIYTVGGEPIPNTAAENYTIFQSTTDVQSYIDFLILSELSLHPYSYYTDLYYYRKSGINYIGPFWDSTYGFNYNDVYSDEEFCGYYADNQLDSHHYTGWNILNNNSFLSFTVIKNIIESANFGSDFFSGLISRWNELRGYKNLLDIDTISDLIKAKHDYLEISNNNNRKRWRNSGINEDIWPDDDIEMDVQTYFEEFEYIERWVKNRILWIDHNIRNLKSHIVSDCGDSIVSYCNDGNAVNFEPYANFNDGTCSYTYTPYYRFVLDTRYVIYPPVERTELHISRKTDENGDFTEFDRRYDMVRVSDNLWSIDISDPDLSVNTLFEYHFTKYVEDVYTLYTGTIEYDKYRTYYIYDENNIEFRHYYNDYEFNLEKSVFPIVKIDTSRNDCQTEGEYRDGEKVDPDKDGCSGWYCPDPDGQGYDSCNDEYFDVDNYYYDNEGEVYSYKYYYDEVECNLHCQVDCIDGLNIRDEPKITAHMEVIYNGENSMNYLDDVPQSEHRIGIEVRGFSHRGFSKKQYSVELQVDKGHPQCDDEAEAWSLFCESFNPKKLINYGRDCYFPFENDFVIFGPYRDKTYMKNKFSYDLWESLGNRGIKTKYIELVINDNYMGLYLFMEAVREGKDRLDVGDILQCTDTEDIESCLGAFIVKVESGAEQDFFAGLDGISKYEWYEPKAKDILGKDVVKEKIKDVIGNLENTCQIELGLGETNYSCDYPTVSDLIDIDGFVDYHIVEDLSFNLEGYTRSQYWYTTSYDYEENGTQDKIYMGPVWDFNHAYGTFNIDYEGIVLDIFPEIQNNFWLALFKEPNFYLRTIERWACYRGYEHENIDCAGMSSGILSTENAMRYIDNIIDKFREVKSIDRERSRWFYEGRDFYEEINYLKNWILLRLSWLDSHWLVDRCLPYNNYYSTLDVCSISGDNCDYDDNCTTSDLSCNLCNTSTSIASDFIYIYSPTNEFEFSKDETNSIKFDWLYSQTISDKLIADVAGIIYDSFISFVIYDRYSLEEIHRFSSIENLYEWNLLDYDDVEGDYFIIAAYGEVSTTDGKYYSTSSNRVNFSIKSITSLTGCTDINAINFDIYAQDDDGSCKYKTDCDEKYLIEASELLIETPVYKGSNTISYPTNTAYFEGGIDFFEVLNNSYTSGHYNGDGIFIEDEGCYNGICFSLYDSVVVLRGNDAVGHYTSIYINNEWQTTGDRSVDINDKIVPGMGFILNLNKPGVIRWKIGGDSISRSRVRTPDFKGLGKQ